MGHHHNHNGGHDHGHHHDHNGDNLAFAFWLNTGFALLELVGGFLTNSVAILSDALHDLGDSLALGSAWFLERKSKQARDETYTYGYKRFSLAGAMINAVVLTVGSIFIMVESAKRVISPVQPDASGMIVFAIIGIAVNGFALLRLRKGHSVNEKMISLHFVEDVAGWVAVLVGSIVMKFIDAPIIDPLLSLLIAILILVNVFRNMRGAFQIILQGVPLNVSEDQVRHQLASFPEIAGMHDLHLWTLDGNYHILTTHIVLDKPLALAEQESLKQKIKSRLKDIHVEHATIEFESRDVDCDQEKH